MDKLTIALANKPVVGGAASVGTGVAAYCDVITPYLEFGTLVIGIAIGLLTLYGLIRKNFFSQVGPA